MIEGTGTQSTDPFTQYTAHGDGFDELVSDNGEIREHWKPFIERFGSFPVDKQINRAERLRRLVQETGIAQDVFSEAHTSSEPWKIDPIPFVVSSNEWQFLEAALLQRAKLCAAVLDDLYGEQSLSKAGHIPPQLILGDPSFLRPLSGIESGAGRLSYFAVDFTRDAFGNWQVLDTHTETVAGLGFALANRIVHSRVFSDLMLASRALRLSGFFNDLHGELIQRAGREDASIALLTPGAHHEDYFGQAYLARYLSLMLVQGGDLRVVGDRVYMKTLEGLRPIDLLVRCVASELADPLLLDPGGFLGPAGLVQAVRANPDLASNALGTAVLENRGLGVYLGNICNVLLGEDLKAPSYPRLWLGDAGVRESVLANFDNFALRKAQEGTGRPGRSQSVILPSQLDPDARDAIQNDLAINGYRYVAEEGSRFATLPSWTHNGVQPASVALRLFATLVDGEYQVMPGGIALDLDTSQGYPVYSESGNTRDVWVCSVEETHHHSTSRLHSALVEPKITRGGLGLRSRVADNLFWLGRYVERTDWTMRLVRGALSRLDLNNAALQHRETLVLALDLLLSKDEDFVELRHEDAAIEQRARALISGRGRRFGLIETISNIHRVSYQIRDRLSAELWRTLQAFQGSPLWTGDAEPQSLSEALDHLDQGIAAVAAFNGMAAENMTRGFGWTFLDLGRRIERAQNLSELLGGFFAERKDEASEAAALTFALEVADSLLTYRSRYLFAPMLPLVLDLLLSDETNPRSIAYPLAQISDHLEQLPKNPNEAPQTEERKLILDLLTRVRIADMYELCQIGDSSDREALKGLFNQLVADLPELSQAITRRYFNLTEDVVTRLPARVGSQL
ncbi:MAG: circularly permuted type 2 ATP-grasp protein [Hyphomicrobiales bacterium]|nr:circularly permuted type 2 ATP-grasp protein [Hyphomicrobiales bacterium]